MKLTVIGAGSHLLTVPAAGPLPSLDAALRQVCRERLRRVDRFIELALLGAGRCAAGRALKPDCGVYLGLGFGPIASNIASQVAMFTEQEPPKPFDFMNTLGASAGFHVARNLGLSGQNLCVSRRGACLEALLALAAADLALGIVSQALVGVVEEATLPLDQHRRRRGLPPDTPVAEGSHWLLLEQSGGAGKTLQMQRFPGMTELEAWLEDHYAAGDSAYWAADDDGSTPDARLRQRFVADAPNCGLHGNPQAAWLAEFLVAGRPGSLFLISAGSAPGRGYCLLHFSP